MKLIAMLTKLKVRANFVKNRFLVKLGCRRIPPERFIQPRAYMRLRMTEVLIPEGVEYIGAAAFAGCRELKKVTLPSTLREIGNDAFWGCTSLTGIRIPDSVTSIGIGAFYGCSRLKTVRLPEKLETIWHAVFENTALTEVTLPDTVTEIEPYAFRNCKDLKTVSFPARLARIGCDAFSGCTSLTSPLILLSATRIDKGAFCGCPIDEVYLPCRCWIGYKALPAGALISLPDVRMLMHLDRSETRLRLISSKIQCPTGTFTVSGCEKIPVRYAKGSFVEKLILSPGTERIGDEAFMYCQLLEQVILPPTLRLICRKSFAGCSKLKSIRVPSSVTEIAGDAFPEHTRIIAEPGSYAYRWAEKRSKLAE